MGHEAEIDNIINELSIGWRIERMPKVDLCVLRVAIYEMLYRDDIPCGVSINEAVELAKQFGGDRSSAYIKRHAGHLCEANRGRTTGIGLWKNIKAYARHRLRYCRRCFIAGKRTAFRV